MRLKPWRSTERHTPSTTVDERGKIQRDRAAETHVMFGQPGPQHRQHHRLLASRNDLARGARGDRFAQHAVHFDRQMRPVLLKRGNRQDHDRVLPRLLAQLIGAQLAPLHLGGSRHRNSPCPGVAMGHETAGEKREARMNLHRLLGKRLESGRPVRVGLIGAGKFGSMFLSQVPSTPGIEVAAIADLAPDRAREACRRVGWTEERIAATRFTDDAMAMIAGPEIEVVVEATGHAPAGIAHARRAIAERQAYRHGQRGGRCAGGSALAREAERAGVVYSLAYGDQPALICELVDWARACGFRVIAAGKGTKYLPEYHASTPATVWGYYGLTEEQARIGGMNPQMFNSFLDGTKSGIEMAAVANATGLTPPPDGLGFPPCGTHEMAEMLRPVGPGGGGLQPASRRHRRWRTICAGASMCCSRRRTTTPRAASRNMAW